MTCGHCAGAAKKAIHCADSQATVAVDLASNTGSIVTSAVAAEISKSVGSAGDPNKAV
ncbi:copper chaperone [Pseudorhizobium halotolerans]|uniref:Copper chaperone n=2 Tax=Rhizobiaceae TaxID=82115 RepID=A0ABN7JYA4_9HYPH|nr:copper chaperone [Pseudorhizobium halotolerans]